MLPFSHHLALYRRNNFGQPCVWYAVPFDNCSIQVYHGIIGKTISNEIIHTHRDPKDEVKSRFKAKEKAGYKYLSELKDNDSLPVEGELFNYLNAYLPFNRTSADGSMLPMLAKAYDNTKNKLFSKNSTFLGQWKINGLRCFISAKSNACDLFKPISLQFQSREGTYWKSLGDLEEYLLSVLDSKLLEKMVEEHYILDGELYLPGYSVNMINHFVKDPNCKENKLLQYWCYDVAVEDSIQELRLNILYERQNKHIKVFTSKNDHLNNAERLIVLPIYIVKKDYDALILRNKFIQLGFEGLIMRKPDAEYQYGKRNLSMIKYKKSTDGKFLIIDIYPEGVKRSNIPLIQLKNDINNATFEVHVGGSFEYQESVLKNKEKYIGKYMYVEYGERSGVTEVPFHVKETKILT